MLIAHVLRDKGATVHTLSGDATLEQAAQELDRRKVGSLVVIEGSRVIGVFSERDLVREVAKRGCAALDQTTVGAAMTRDVVTARPDETLDDCLARMTDRRIRHLPVIDADGALIGLVSIGDLVKHRIAAAEAEAAAMQAYITTH